MKYDALRDAEKYMKDHKRKKHWYRVVTVLACVVVFCTTYALILPAITLEKQCDIPEHTHTEACYTQVTSVEKKVPVCSAETLGIHQHTASCYDADGNLTCGYADFVVHQHDSACYDENGKLWCPLPEIEAHRHTGSCYALPEETVEEVHAHTDACYTLERGELICQEHVHTDACYTETTVLLCGLEESAGHQHDESCMDESGEIICGLECSEGHQHSGSCYETSRELTCGIDSDHQHTDDCYEWSRELTCDISTEPAESTSEEDVEPVLVCEKPEVILHRHTPDCFDANGNLICGQIQVLEHQHTDACFETVTEPVDTEALTCTNTDPDHVHTARCYGTWELTCGMEEHTPSEECQGAAELTEEEQAQVDAVIALIDALPSNEEIEETAAAFEEAEDEEGLEAYLSEVYPQVNAAYEAYAALTDAQKAKVTNADKLMALEWIWSAATLETDFPVLTDDSARVTGITVTGISDGVAPWDENDNAGNDSSDNNKIVRTFDTVTYRFEVQMESYDSTSYSEARVKLEFVLPLTSEQAVFDQTAMAWMDQTSGYAPELTTETRSIDGVDKACQVLTCYKRLLPSEGHRSVVPGTFGENVTINVKSMKNGDTFAPIFSAAMECGTWEGDCSTHGQQEKFTVQAEDVKISAAPKYNIQLNGQSSYKSTFDFNSGNSLAQAYGDGYGKGEVIGRVSKYGIVLQLYNDNASKGFKGIELPDGSPITFDLQLSSVYTVNMPNPGSSYTQGQKIPVTDTYMPLLWSCDGNIQTSAGSTNSDGRVLYDTHGNEQQYAPAANGDRVNACYSSGNWTAVQDGATIHITVSGYQVDPDKMPIYNDAYMEGDPAKYGEALGIGCFSAGEVWIVQPYNKIGETSANEGPNFDVVQDYGQGSFATTIEDSNLKATSVSGQSVNGSQMKTDDDRKALTLELTLPGSFQNRVAYLSLTDRYKGVGIDDPYDGRDFATIGTEFRIRGGFSYRHENEEDNLLYWGTNLTKFYGSAIEIIDSQPDPYIYGGANPKEWTVYYATKQDGTDWKDDYELQHTYEDDMIFYKNLSDIPEGHLCVGLLFCFKQDTFGEISSPHFLLHQKARVRDNMDLAGQTFMLASTSRCWTKSMFESAGMTLDDIPDWSNPNTKLSSFPTRHYKSGNIQGSFWYIKETYAADGSGALGTHNSDWQHWGDTLLVIGYKTGITKTLCQTSDGTTTKSTYNLDAEQRVVDFKLQPRTYFDQGTTNHSVSTTVTIVDTLPKYLTYRAGSSYFGGTYTQTSANGGTQGSITGGVLREPVVTNNADGTQTLTWVIQDVSVGEAMPAIYYSADIGDRNNPDNDVPIGTTNLLNTVRITATHDLRQPTIANGNYAEAGIAVTRGTASSFGKYAKQKLVEPDGVIDYVVYFDNNASAATDVLLLDAMPVNGVNGSHFNGTYAVNSWKLDAEKCEADELAVYYTVDTAYKGATIDSLGGKDSALVKIKGWTKADVSEDGSVTAMNGQQPTAWAVIGSLESNKGVYVDLQIQLKPEASTADAAVQNNYYVNALSCNDTTITVETQTINRTLEGLTWLDDNADGVQNEPSTNRISGVKVSLWKLKDGGDANNEADYVPYCYPGTSTQIVIETGQQVSVLAADAKKVTDYELGRYKFTDMPAGTFAVKFEDGSTKISPYIASPANMGQNDTLDSDGIPEYSADKTTLQKTVILGISMPKAEEMSVVLYESKYHDSGFYERGYELPDTGGTGTTSYTAGGLLLIFGAAALLYIHNKRRKGDAVSS